MSPQEAERIVQTFGRIIGDRHKDERVINVFSLPYSPAKIKYAYFLYTETLINRGLFADEIKNSLSITYASLDTIFIEGDVAKLNQTLKLYAKDPDARQYVDEQGGLTAFMPSTVAMNEYHNFVADCYGNWASSDIA
jgi:hypothetical protein